MFLFSLDLKIMFRYGITLFLDIFKGISLSDSLNLAHAKFCEDDRRKELVYNHFYYASKESREIKLFYIDAILLRITFTYKRHLYVIRKQK